MEGWGQRDCWDTGYASKRRQWGREGTLWLDLEVLSPWGQEGGRLARLGEGGVKVSEQWAIKVVKRC